MGALPELFAATDPAAESGQYIGPDGRNEMKGHPTVVRPVGVRRGPGDRAPAVGALRRTHRVRFDLSTAA